MHPLTDYDPPTTMAVEITGEAGGLAPDTLSLFNWNIGYCGLGEESDFFYDGGKSVRSPKEIVEKNLAGILAQLNAAKAETDFFLLQEVDRHSSRSHTINEVDQVSAQLTGFSQAFGTNYKVSFHSHSPDQSDGRCVFRRFNLESLPANRGDAVFLQGEL